MAHKNLIFEKTCVFSVNSEKYIEVSKVKDLFHLPQVFFSRICRTNAKSHFKLHFAVKVKVFVNLHIFRSDEQNSCIMGFTQESQVKTKD